MDPLDMQQSWLRQQVYACYREIEESENPIRTLVFKAYKAVEDYMLSITNHDYGEGMLVLLGGITVAAHEAVLCIRPRDALDDELS